MYPGYLEANREVFVDGDVENGAPTGKVERMAVIESLKLSMGGIVETSCRAIEEVV